MLRVQYNTSNLLSTFYVLITIYILKIVDGWDSLFLPWRNLKFNKGNKYFSSSDYYQRCFTSNMNKNCENLKTEEGDISW